jgi:ribosomal protein L37AE/L43A
MNSADPHILPEWDKQVEYIRKYRLYLKFLSILYIILKKAKSINSNERNNKSDKLICPRCHSMFVYRYIRKEQYYCRTCQYAWTDNKENKKIEYLLSVNSNLTIDKKLANGLKLTQMAKSANTEKPRCPKCNSAWTYHRIYREEWYCRTCQYSWPYDDTRKEMKLEPSDARQKN